MYCVDCDMFRRRGNSLIIIVLCTADFWSENYTYAYERNRSAIEEHLAIWFLYSKKEMDFY